MGERLKRKKDKNERRKKGKNEEREDRREGGELNE